MTVSVRAAVVLALLERYFSIGVSLISSVVLARLLRPEQIGVFSVSLAIIGMAMALREMGVGNYLIQVKELEQLHVRAATGVSLLFGGVLFIIFFGSAQVISEYYREPRIKIIIWICSLNFLLMPFASIPLALLRRDMKFRPILLISVGSSAIGATTSIALAFMGAGEASLAVGAIATNLSAAVGGLFAIPRIGYLLPSLRRWKAVLRFGGPSSLVGMITSISMDANDLIVSKIMGFHSVAMLSRGNGLVALLQRDLMGAVRGVALPAFAKAHREGTVLVDPFARSVSIVCLISWTYFGLVSIYGLEIIDLMFGVQWHAAASVLPILCLAGAVSAVNALTPNVLIAVGRINTQSILDLIFQPLKVLIIFIGATWFGTLDACAIAVLIATSIAMPFSWLQKIKYIGEDWIQTSLLLAKTVAATGVMLLLPITQFLLFGLNRKEPLPIWQWVPVVALSCGVGLVAVVILRHPIIESLRNFAAFERVNTFLNR